MSSPKRSISRRNEEGQRQRRRTLARAALVIGLIGGIALLGEVATAGRTRGAYLGVALLAQSLSIVEREYVEAVSVDELLEGAVRGMLRTLDPHSSLLTPQDAKIFSQDLEGKFGGVGLEVSVKGDDLVVIAPMPGSPAHKAGLEPGDRIVSIDGRPTRSVDIEQAVRLMRGEPGTKVHIGVLRGDELLPRDVTLTRAVIEVARVESAPLGPGYFRIVVPSFIEGTAASIETEIERLESGKDGLKGIVLDLRRNPGGLVIEAVATADLFIDSGVIVSTRGKDGKVVDEYTARRVGTHSELPMVTLIDSASASAAEIVAGALQDHGRSLLVGTRSFGKGSVQNMFPLDGGYALRLTVARYHTPAGRSIQAQGIEPDVLVESQHAPQRDPSALPSGAEGLLPGHLPGKERTSAPRTEDDRSDDYPLDLAFQILRGLASGQAAKARSR